jgi:hypothetical protein
MKNVTLSADEELIEQARLVAKSQHKTLNVAFREWLEDYVSRRGDVQAHRALMQRLKHINVGGPYTRDEMNER